MRWCVEAFGVLELREGGGVRAGLKGVLRWIDILGGSGEG